MNWIKQKWLGLEYKDKFYIFLLLGVAFLVAAVLLISNARLYKSGADIAALTQRSGDTVPVHNGGIITILDSHPPFQWMGELPDVSVSATELPMQDDGAYIIDGTLEDICLRLIHAGFIFDTSYGGTTLVSATKICYLYWSGRTLIAQIEDMEGHEND